MSQVCQKCGKEYEPKRRGGKFCSTSCRVTRHQLTRRGRVLPVLHSGDEVYLANKLAAVGRSSVEMLAKVQGLPAEQVAEELRRLVEGWAGAANNSVIERILADVTKERHANYEAYRKRTGLY
ncbi:hypothetical protein KLP40_20950 [Hymenobacter sp. NST-14]|uniref:hypothetical protein n=1 Tax=Hymenobacter piscis TaxID=2839984 RepID=UPI001C0109CC|nr:hypothetical protein [Hymenobacter piscis]MBT9395647.1 hypothetical protein [Hymenobacter piscis]